MRGAIYNKLAWTNIRKNRKTYLPYMVSAIGMVMMFFIILNLSLDSQIGAFEEGDWAQVILGLGAIVIGIFSLIFLFYTNSFLMKRRKTELGLYNVLGMGKTHIAKVLFWENLFTALISIAVGTAGGMVFSKAAQVLLLRMMGKSIDYTFSVQPAALLITALLFAGIFVVIYLKSAIEVGRLNTVGLLYSRTQGETEPKGNFVLALFGLVFLGAGYVMAMKVQHPADAIMVFFIAVIAVIIGTYCSFIAGSVALLKLLRRNKNYYYQTSHFISTSSMIFRMKKHGAGLASICILSTMVLVMISSTACLYFGANDAVNSAYPRDVEVSVSLYNSNPETFAAASADLDAELEKTLAEQGLKAEHVLRYTMCDFFAKKSDGTLIPASSYQADTRSYSVMTAEEYNRNFGTDIQLERSQLLYKKNEGSLQETMLTLADKRYAVVGEAEAMVMRGADASDLTDCTYLVVADQNEFDRIRDYLLQSQAGENFRLIVCRELDLVGTDGQAPDEAQLAAAAKKMQDQIDSSRIGTYDGNKPQYTALYLSFRTKGDAMAEFTHLYGGLFFLGILLSLAFLGATVMIMYYKQITEGYDDKERFRILRDVGMSDREIRRSIRDQVLKVFFVPLLGAGLHIAFAFHIIRLMIRVFGISNSALLIYTTLASFLLFAVFYVIVYLITSKAYYKIVAVEP